MRRKFMMLGLVVLLIGCFVTSSFGDEYDFRKTRWGMTQQAVMACESIKPVKHRHGKGLVLYKSKILGKAVGITYDFIQNKLVKASYVLTETHTNKNDFIQDYKHFKNALTKKYGTPKVDKVVWSNDLFKGNPSRRGLAVSMGHLGYLSQWQTATSDISCILHGDNYKISCVMQYKSRRLQHLEQQEKRKKSHGWLLKRFLLTRAGRPEIYK